MQRPSDGEQNVGPPSEKPPAGKSPSQNLSKLQLALTNSLFGGKIKLSESDSLAELQKQVKAKWSCRTVPEALDNFITSNAPNGTKIPKLKDERVELFWTILSGMD